MLSLRKADWLQGFVCLIAALGKSLLGVANEAKVIATIQKLHLRLWKTNFV